MKKLTKPKPAKNCCRAAKASKPAPEKAAQCCAKSSRLVAGCHGMAFEKASFDGSCRNSATSL